MDGHHDRTGDGDGVIEPTQLAEPTAPAPPVDPMTLREPTVSPAAAASRLAHLRARIRTAADEVAELLSRGELVSLLRACGDLDAALSEGRRAVDRAELVGTAAQQHLARLRLAGVQQRCGNFAEANLAFTELVHAAGQFGPVIEAFTHHDAGLNAFEQGDWVAAREHFGRALRIREQHELPDEQVAASKAALAAVDRRSGQTA